MTYNLHPIFVHFPIAFLLLYSVIKILPLKKWFPNISWIDIERILLVTGVFGAFMALLTGETAEQLVHPNRQLVNTHSTFAIAATYIYGALLIGEASMFIKKGYFINSAVASKVLNFLERIFSDKFFSCSLAFVALISLSLAGLLGGVIAYGITADPLAPLVLKILGITI